MVDGRLFPSLAVLGGGEGQGLQDDLELQGSFSGKGLSK